MRDLHEKQLITGDYICVHGDVVANIPLHSALTAHKARRAKDKKNIMTMVLCEASNTNRTKSENVRPCFVLDIQTEQCIHYEEVRPRETARLDISEEVLKEHTEIEIRQDLIDCGIDICTPEVLAQWSDNFDWQVPRRGLLRGILKDYETYQLMIHTHVVPKGYAARAKNLQAYDLISKDVVSRWTYPLCPDTNLVPGQSYQLLKSNMYKEDGVVLARSSVISNKTVLGRGTSVGERSTVANSIIGRRCVIGDRVKINGAYLWDDATIGDDTIIDTAIVANKASIGKRCVIEKGALISYGVKIADGMRISSYKRVTKRKRKRSYDEEHTIEETTDPSIVGEGGEGFLLDLDEEEEDVEALLAGMQSVDLTIADESISDLESDAEDVEYDNPQKTSRTGSFASVGSEESSESKRNAADFHHEAANSIFDDLQKGTRQDEIQLELTALALASNTDAKQIRRAVGVAMSKHIATLHESGAALKDAVARTIPPYQRLVRGCVNIKKVDEQVEFLLFMQTDLVHRQQGDKILLFASNALATNDLIDADGFEQWWGDKRSSISERMEKVRAETKQLVDVLVYDDAETEEDDDDDDEEEED